MIVPHFFIIVMGLMFSRSASGIYGPRRPKRILGGDELFEKDRRVSPIKALDYYVWIGHSWLCHDDIPYWNRLWRFFSPTGSAENPLVYALLRVACPAEDPNHLICGGTLITPRIVQTACHCISDIKPDRYDRYTFTTWSSFTLRSHWENNLILYMGKTEVANFDYPISSNRFAAHEDCGQLNKYPWYYRYDIGWIILQDKDEIPLSLGVYKGVWTGLDYAGPYKMDHLNEFYHRVLDQRQVCLVTGYGVTDLSSAVIASKTFKFGWMQVLDFGNCYDVTWKSLKLHRFAPYNRSASWACLYPLQPWNPSQRTPTLGAMDYRGDSGSPITCGDNYFALVSTTTAYDLGEGAGYDNISLSTVIQSTPEANAVEYRRDFEGKVLFGRYNPDNLRILKFPNGSIHFQTLKYAEEKFMNKLPKKLERVPSSALRAPSLGSIPSVMASWISLCLTLLYVK